MTSPKLNYYYVDEAGDLTIFGRRGKNLIGTEGVSKCFMVGVAHIPEPIRLVSDLNDLRLNLLNDPYLQSIPSLSPKAGKTARCFHAKDDCPEVRMQVFKLLADHEIKIQVGIRRKSALIAEIREETRLAQMVNPKAVKTWDPNEIYDDIIKTLFKRLLHKSECIIYFARRGKSSREEALNDAIERAKKNFLRDKGILSDKPTRVVPSVPSEEAGLQVIDYFLWALQRFYERGENRYFDFLRPHYRLIMDFDDKRRNQRYGEWYSDNNPLSKEKMKPVTG
jgi:hypothetical protein